MHIIMISHFFNKGNIKLIKTSFIYKCFILMTDKKIGFCLRDHTVYNWNIINKVGFYNLEARFLKAMNIWEIQPDNQLQVITCLFVLNILERFKKWLYSENHGNWRVKEYVLLRQALLWHCLSPLYPFPAPPNPQFIAEESKEWSYYERKERIWGESNVILN